ncbi:DnaJ domain [Fusarium oxysporum f. sp. vasinfectum]|nr:DnaJ domain [Fusarium oxysporum f. sp. vasinfectum]
MLSEGSPPSGPNSTTYLLPADGPRGLKHHPDKNPGQEEDANLRFQAIQQAYEVLSDASRARGSNSDSSDARGNPWSNMRDFQTRPRQHQADSRTGSKGTEDQKFPAGVPPSNRYTNSKPKSKNADRPTTKRGREQPTPPPPPPPRTESARPREKASFGSRTKSSNYRSPHSSSPYSSSPNPDASAQAPPPVPQRPSPTAKTDPPDTVNPHTMDKDNSPATTSTPPPRPREFPFQQPAQTTSPPHPVDLPKRSQQPAELKQSSGTIPMPPAAQDTNAKPASPEWESGNVETPNANEESFPTPPTAPQIPASIDGVQPSVSDSETYLKDFKNYLEQWNMFKNRIIGHFLARKGTITNLQNSGSGDIQQYSDWLVHDAEIRGLFIAAVEEHEIQFRQFRQFMMLFLSSSNTGHGDK